MHLLVLVRWLSLRLGPVPWLNPCLALRTLASKCGFDTLLDPRGGWPAAAGLGVLIKRRAQVSGRRR